MSKVISRLLCFCITTLWLINKTRATFSTNGNPNQNQSCFVPHAFSRACASYMYLFRILIGSLCCLHLLWLVKVITLVLVLRHSIGNHSTILPCNSFILPRKIGKRIFLGRSKRSLLAGYSNITTNGLPDNLISNDSTVLILGSWHWCFISPFLYYVLHCHTNIFTVTVT